MTSLSICLTRTYLSHQYDLLLAVYNKKKSHKKAPSTHSHPSHSRNLQCNCKWSSQPLVYSSWTLSPFSSISLPAGGQNNGLNSQMVRQGLRAVVSGRQTVGNGNGSNNGIRRNMNSPLDTLVGGPNGNGNLVDSNSNPNNPNNNLMINQQQQQQQSQQQQMPNQMINADMDPTMRFGFEMPQGTWDNFF